MKDDMISKQVAIESVCTMLKNCFNATDEMLESVKITVGELPPAEQWIPWDSGRLPEESGTYTVTAYDGTTKRVTHAKYQKRLKRWELTGTRAYCRVLAWLPPIEPWEGEKDG